MRLPGIFTASLLALTLPATASAQQGYTWEYGRHVMADVFETSLSLVYGVPETDDVQMFADCGIGAGGPLVRATVGAPIGDLPGGAGVQISFSAPGYAQTLNAEVVRHEEFFHGVEIVIEPDDSLLTELAQRAALTYAVHGQPAATISLAGSAGPVRSFAGDCAHIGDLTPNIVPASSHSSAPPIGSFGCNMFPGLASRNSDVAQNVTFVNNSPGYRVVMWLGFDGQPVEYGRLNPGESLSLQSFLTHPWMFTDGPGNCIQIIELQPGVSSYSIAAPSPDFGSE
ncbi:hypothetical protein [Pararhodobacter oceanensis]|uniref:VHL beta domain-containing protein n=1 Tax=Pararhodobacter oceanensis TaxID=2172121 RepID=UPI003A953746